MSKPSLSSRYSPWAVVTGNFLCSVFSAAGFSQWENPEQRRLKARQQATGSCLFQAKCSAPVYE